MKTEHNIIRILTGRRQTSWLFTASVAEDLNSGLRGYKKQIQVVVRAGLEPGTAGLQVRHADHSTMLSPPIAESLRQNSCNKIIIACKPLQITSVDTSFRTHFLTLFTYLFLFHIPFLNLFIKLHNVLFNGLFFHLLFLVVTIQLRVSKKIIMRIKLRDQTTNKHTCWK